MDFATVKDNASSGKYKNTVPYPNRIEKGNEPKVPKDSKYYDLVWAEYNGKKEDFNEKMLLYRKGESEKMKLFHSDLIMAIMEAGANEKQAAKIYSKAWDRGHSSGLFEVVGEAEDLVEIIQP